MITFHDRTIIPMKLSSLEKPFDDEAFLYELKFDGIRCLAYVNGGVELVNKRHKVVTNVYPELQAMKQAVQGSCILDGEIVVFDDFGKPAFPKLQARSLLTNPLKISLKQKSTPVTFVAYDLLWLNGRDVTMLPLMERKQLLNQTVKENNFIILSRYSFNNGVKLFAAVKKLKLEGIVAKRIDGEYVTGQHRTNLWYKMKYLLDEDFIVCGYTVSSGKLSVLLGKPDKNGFSYVGSVVVHNKTEQSLVQKLPTVKKPWFVTSKTNVTWVQPKLVGTAQFMLKTKEGRLRQPTLKSIRTD